MEPKRRRKSKAQGDEGVRSETPFDAEAAKQSRGTPPPGVVTFLHLDVLLRPYLSNIENAELGEWDIRQAVIKYDSFVSPQVMRETILHELLHTILEHTSIDNEIHEEIIRALSPLLLSMIRTNPELIAYLTSE